MNININEVLPKLSGVKKSGSQWIAKCPSHNDSKASFTIKETNDGCIFHCFAGCDFNDIVQALGINEREHFEQSEQSEREHNKQKSKIIDTYEYVNENGHLLYEILRYEPKDFRIRRPDGKGGYFWNLGDTRRVIYQLPEILRARETDFFVVFCEGEKDADNVREKLDLPATTIATGANAWRDEFADFFFGLNVVILPDNDKAGKDFAETVANSIYNKAQSVTVVNLPTLAEKGDVSDWIENGGTREELLGLIKATSEWQLTENIENETDASLNNTEDFFICKPVSQWLEEAMKSPIPKMLFGEFWHEGEISILFADTNAGKRILAVQIADSISRGKQIGSLKCEVEAQEVFYFDFELNSRQFGNRYGRNENGFLTDVYPFDNNFNRLALNPNAVPTDTEKFEDTLFNRLEKLIEQRNSKILIIDNITYLKNDNEKAKEALSLMKRLKNLKDKYDLSVLALAHTPKRFLEKPISLNDLAGSKMLINFCDSAFSIGKSSKDKDIRYVKQIKERNTAKIYGEENVCVAQVVKPSNFLCFDFISFGDEKEHLLSNMKPQRQAEIERVKALKADGKTQRESSEIMGISLGKVNELLKKGESQDSPTINEDVHFVHCSEGVNDLNIFKLETFIN